MKDALVKLLKIKSLVTIVIIGILAYMSITDRITAEQFLPIATMVLTFYFSKKDTDSGKDD